MIGVGVGFVSPGFRIPAQGRARRLPRPALELARWPSASPALAGRGQRTLAANASTLHRPTEMVLGLAVDDLWRAIPEALRADLGDVPALAHTLEQGATELRGLITSLQESEASDGVADADRAAIVETRLGLESAAPRDDRHPRSGCGCNCCGCSPTASKRARSRSNSRPREPSRRRSTATSRGTPRCAGCCIGRGVPAAPGTPTPTPPSERAAA
ncbi:MAG: hypothetical protein V9E87_11330 [Gemmatimonadales bacterium]